MKQKYETVIGLEVHVELATKSKMFCGCPADHFGKKPNTQTCPVCLGLPGTLPVPNRRAVEWTILLGLALNSAICEESKFDRKNYFYPDLPKGYQISQYDMPLCVNGTLSIANSEKKQRSIRIARVHLEEDTGKLQHALVEGEKVSLVDFNRSGVPLVEIVTEPDFRTIEEVDIFLKKLQQLIRYLGISGADMEKGSMRLEPSISLRLFGQTALPTYRVELKNINSFRFARKALEYEIERQTELLDNGEKPAQQTRGWNEAKNATVVQRQKEEANDYRYFPEPDIPPMRWELTEVSKIKSQIPELPDKKKVRFIKEYGLNDYDAGLLTETRQKADYYEEAVKSARMLAAAGSNLALELWPKTVANWLINRGINTEEVVPAQLIDRIRKATSVTSLTSGELGKIVAAVICENTKAVNDYKNGKQEVIGFLIGQAQKLLKGKGNAREIADTLKEYLIKK